MSTNRSVVIVGGGLIGLSTALFLTEQGAEVTVIDSGSLGSGAARGNAGFMNNAMLNPLAGPGAILNALKSFKDPTRALRVHPMQVPLLAPWFLRFAMACTAKKYEATSKALVDFNSEMNDALAVMEAVGVEAEKGAPLLCPFHDEAFGIKFANEVSDLSVHFGEKRMEMLDGDQVRKLAPAVTDHVRNGFFIPTDKHIDPRKYTDTLISVLKSRGATLVENASLSSVEQTAGRITRLIFSNGQSFGGDEFLLAAGAGIRPLGKLFDLSIPVVPGQGYNVMLPSSPGLHQPVIFEEAHAVATPFNDRIRLGGTMEFGGQNPKFDGRRVDAIIASLGKFINLDFGARTDTWAGLRPMSPDGKALLGRPKGWSNLTVAGGHGMYGLSLAPVTGRSMAELILAGRSKVDLAAFNPNRFKL